MTRHRLPDRREADTFQLAHAGVFFTVTVGRYADGRPAEVFVDGLKVGTDMRESVRDAALAVSIALQHGCPLATLVRAVARDGDGRPLSVVGAVIDAMAQEGCP